MGLSHMIQDGVLLEKEVLVGKEVLVEKAALVEKNSLMKKPCCVLKMFKSECYIALVYVKKNNK